MNTETQQKQIPSAEELLPHLALVPRRVMDAWSRLDGQAFADVFTEDGSMVMPGIEVIGRADIAEFMGQAFQGPYLGTQVVGEPSRVTVLSEDTAILHTVGGVRAVTATEVDSDKEVRATWVMVRRGDEWLLASYQNSPKQAAQ